MQEEKPLKRLVQSWIGIVIRAVRLLLITEGAGYYQERGKPARVVRKGDVIKCADRSFPVYLSR